MTVFSAQYANLEAVLIQPEEIPFIFTKRQKPVENPICPRCEERPRARSKSGDLIPYCRTCSREAAKQYKKKAA